MVLIARAAAALALAALVLPAALPAQPRGATIRGRVELPPMLPSADRRPSAGDLGESPAPGVPGRRRAVVYFETAPRGAFEDREGRASMDQRNETFVPHLLAITVGTTVDFPNSDSTYHNVFSLSRTRRFDLGRYAAGRSKAVRFDRPGIVRVFCDIHSHMSAFILVFSHRFYSVTGEDGRYQIGSVPPGTYTLVAWLDGSIRDTRSVSVGPDTRDVEIDFPLR